MEKIQILKKNGNIEKFTPYKIKNAIRKSAERVLVTLSDEEEDKVCSLVLRKILDSGITKVPVMRLHNMVEVALDKVNKKVARSYREYRNYKTDFADILNEVYKRDRAIRFIGDKENSNTDSALVSTKRVLVYNEFNRALYRKFNLTALEREATELGYIYEHDESSRRDTYNCCLFDAGKVMSGGFEMGNMWYNEPTTIDKACDVLGDIMSVKASQQYGGLTIPEVDKILAKYLEKSHNLYIKQMIEDFKEISGCGSLTEEQMLNISNKAYDKAVEELENGLQGIEYKANSVASSRGDYPFLTFTFGEDTDNPYSVQVASSILKVRKKGQGKPGKKKCVLFPKLVFLYVEDKHGKGKEFEYLFDEAIDCSAKCMYPDYLSLTGEGYVPNMYKKYKKIISPMG